MVSQILSEVTKDAIFSMQVHTRTDLYDKTHAHIMITHDELARNTRRNERSVVKDTLNRRRQKEVKKGKQKRISKKVKKIPQNSSSGQLHTHTQGEVILIHHTPRCTCVDSIQAKYSYCLWHCLTSSFNYQTPLSNLKYLAS